MLKRLHKLAWKYPKSKKKQKRPRKMGVKRKEMAEERSSTTLNKHFGVSKSGPISICKKRKHKSRSDHQFETNRNDSDVGCSNVSSNLCELATFTKMSSQSKFQLPETDEFRDTPKSYVRAKPKKSNTSIRVNSFHQRLTKYDDGSVEKLNHHLKYKFSNSPTDSCNSSENLQFKQHDLNIKILSDCSYSLCDVASSLSSKSMSDKSMQKTNEYRDTPKFHIRAKPEKLNTSTMVNSFDQRKSKIEIGSGEKPSHDLRYKHRSSHSYDNSKNIRFEEHDPDTKISSDCSFSLCDVTSSLSSKSVFDESIQKTNEYRDTPKFHIRAKPKKLNTSTMVNSFDQRQSKVEVGSGEKPSHDLKYKHRSSHSCDYSKNIQFEQHDPNIKISSDCSFSLCDVTSSLSSKSMFDESIQKTNEYRDTPKFHIRAKPKKLNTSTMVNSFDQRLSKIEVGSGEKPSHDLKYKHRNSQSCDYSKNIRFEQHDPDIGILSDCSQTLCNLATDTTPKSSNSTFHKSLKKTGIFREKVNSFDKQKSQAKDGSIKKLNLFDSSENSHDHLELSMKVDVVDANSEYTNKRLKNEVKKKFKSSSKHMYEKKINQDGKYKSCGKHDGHISFGSLRNSTLPPKWKFKSTHQMEMEGQSKLEIKEKITQDQQKLDDIKRIYEETILNFDKHLEIERENRYRRIIEKYENITSEEVIHIYSLKISTKTGKWVNLKSNHLNPTPHNMSGKTAFYLKYLKRLYEQEKLLKKEIKKTINKYLILNSPNKSNDLVNQFISVKDDPLLDTIVNISDKDKVPVKIHSIFNNSNSSLNQTNLLEVDRASENEVTLPLHSPSVIPQPFGGLGKMSQKFDGLSNASSKTKHFNKLLLNSPPVPAQHIPVQWTVIRKSKSTRNNQVLPKASKDPACYIPETCFKTPTTSFNSKSRLQFVVDSFNDSLIPQINSDTSCTSEPDSYIDQKHLLCNMPKGMSTRFSSNNASKSTRTSSRFSKKHVSGLMLDSCSSMNISSDSSKSNFDIKQCNMNCYVLVNRVNWLKYMNKGNVL